MSGFALSYVWLIAGAILVALEVFGVSGIGLIFAGLGALSTGIAIELDWTSADAIISQFAWFFGFTVLWGVLLWKPLHHFQQGSGKGGNFNNIVGDYATTEGTGLTKGRPGTVRWSGTIMQAELSPQSRSQSVTGGARVRVVALRGATLIVEDAN